MIFHSFVLKILSENEICDQLRITVTKLRRLTDNNLKLDIVKINAITQFVKILSICFQVKSGNKIVNKI